MTGKEADKIESALRWLRSHLHRLKLERKSIESKLAQMDIEIDRVSDEIETAEERRRRTSDSR